MPEGILVGFDQTLEEPIVQYAVSKGYRPQSLDTKLTLWVRPDIASP